MTPIPGQPQANDLRSLQTEAMAIFHRYAEDQRSLQEITLSEDAQSNLAQFLAINFRDFPESYVVALLLATGKYWSPMVLEFWKHIIDLVGDNEIAMFTLVLFLRKWLRIEIMPIVAASSLVSSHVIDFVQKYGKASQATEELNWMDRRLLSDLNIDYTTLEGWRRSIRRDSGSYP